jgi:hypothetical protein
MPKSLKYRTKQTNIVCMQQKSDYNQELQELKAQLFFLTEFF